MAHNVALLRFVLYIGEDIQLTRSMPSERSFQVLESSTQSACNNLGHFVATTRTHWKADRTRLYASSGERKYVNLSERAALLAEIKDAPAERRLFILTLVWSGARVSELLALTAASFQLDAQVVSITTLKRRCHEVREIPVPTWLIAELEKCFGLRERQRAPDKANAHLWTFHRTTAWRYIKMKMEGVGIYGARATPRGLRHAFGVSTLAAGIPLNIVQQLLGHASIETTAIYGNAVGPEQRAIVSKFWTVGSLSEDAA